MLSTMVFVLYAQALRISELEYFTGKRIYINMADSLMQRLAYSKGNDTFMFVNPNLDQRIFSYNDISELIKNQDRYELVIGERRACVKDDRLVKCEHGAPTLFSLSKNKNGYSISYDKTEGEATDKLCMTRESDNAVNFRKCTDTKDQGFSFQPVSALECIVNDNVMRGEMVDVPDMARRVVSPVYAHRPIAGGYGPYGGLVDTYTLTSLLHNLLYNRNYAARLMDHTLDGDVYVHGPPATETSVVDGHAIEEQHMPYGPETVAVERETVLRHPIRSKKVKVIPAKTKTKTKTIPLKVRISTTKAPTTETTVTEGVVESTTREEPLDIDRKNVVVDSDGRVIESDHMDIDYEDEITASDDDVGSSL